MVDQFGRAITYMRISVTDRCNLRCAHCMPQGIALAGHDDMLRYEELLRVCAAAVLLGITAFKVTGGEPLVRRGCVEFIARLKAMPGVEQVTLTTNGLLLAEHLGALCAAGVDGVNISLSTRESERYCKLTGAAGDAARQVEHAIAAAVARGLRVKVNAVLLEELFESILPVASLARELPVDVRFIELMPIGEGASMRGIPMERALSVLRQCWRDLRHTDEVRGNGPARYYEAGALQGRIGFIDALSHSFCAACNRVRLTANGMLKPCLCYADGCDIKALLRGGATDAALQDAMRECIAQKPAAHCFAEGHGKIEMRTMNQIGG